ncbi:MAG: PqiC family protein [Polyangia bacterium]
MRLLPIALLLLPACSLLRGARPDPTRFFVLTSVVAKASSPIATTLGVDHLELPQYLRREEFVSRSASNQLAIADYDRWGEALRDGFARTLRRDLESELGSGHVFGQPFEPARLPALTVDIDVRHLEHVDGHGATLEAEWTLRDRVKGTALLVHTTKLTVPAPDKDPAAEVAALSKAISMMSLEIAAAVREQK